MTCACVHCPLVQRAGTEERGTEEERGQMLELEPRQRERNGGTQRQNSLREPKDPGKRKVSLFPCDTSMKMLEMSMRMPPPSNLAFAVR